MARGGFIASKIVLSKVALRLNGNTDLARQALIHGLVSGEVVARGRMLVDHWETKSRSSDDTRASFKIYGSDAQPIPAEFWQSADQEDQHDWDFGEGVFTIPPWDGEIPKAYASVEFKEKSVNQLIKSLEIKAEPRPKQERRRRAEWNEWIAALAVSVAEGRITAASGDCDLIKEIDQKLISWGFEDVSQSTFQGARSEVLQRLKGAEASIEGRRPDPP